MDIEKKLVDELGKNIIEATNEEIYRALVSVVNKAAIDKEERNGKKKLYYI